MRRTINNLFAMLLIALYVGSVNALTDDVEALRAENAALREEIERLRAHSDDARFKAMEINTSDSLGELEEDEAGKATGTGSKECKKGHEYWWMTKGGLLFDEDCSMTEDQFKTQTSGHRLMPLCQKETRRGKTWYVDCQTCPKSGDCTTNPNAEMSAFANEPKWSIRDATYSVTKEELGNVTCPCALADGKPMDSTTALRTIIGQVAKLGMPAAWKWRPQDEKPICDKKQKTRSWREAAWNAKVMVSTMQMFNCWKHSCSAEGAGQLAASEDVQLSGLLEGANLREETELDALVGGGVCPGVAGWELF